MRYQSDRQEYHHVRSFLIPRHHRAGHARARLGCPRFRLRLRRRLCRSPVLWRSDHLPHPGKRGVPRRRACAAELEELRRFHALRPPELRLSRLLRRHRQHGQPLHRRQKAPLQRRLHPRRQGGKAPRPCADRLLPAHPRGIRRHSHRRGRRGSVTAPLRALRLLGRPRAPERARGLRCRPADVRHG